jgi:hypothetical protein
MYLDSATLQSMQWIINAAYNQRSLQSTPLYTAWINHQIWGQFMFGTPERLPAFVAHFSNCNHNIHGSGFKWKNRWCWLYDTLIIHCVAYIVAEPVFIVVKLFCESKKAVTNCSGLWKNLSKARDLIHCPKSNGQFHC